MRKWLNNYLELSRRTYNGLLVMIFLIGILQLVPIVYSKFMPELVLTAEEMDAVNQLLSSDTIVGHQRIAIIDPAALKKAGKRSRDLFRFDPNRIDSADWVRLGLSGKQARSVMNYRRKGGKFYRPEDLRKMYTISEQMYQRLFPYVDIEKDTNFRSRYPEFSSAQRQERHFEKAALVELNSADTTALDALPGIGAVFARRISKYRDRLGGFYKKEQLLEVFGFDSLRYGEISSRVRIDDVLIRRINVNTAAHEDFRNHPYLRYKQINAIIEYRKQHGFYAGPEDLGRVAILSPELIEKLLPYLAF